MSVLFVVALLFLGANARPNGGWQQGPPMGGPMPGPSGGRWPPGGGRFPPGPVGPMPGQMEAWREWDVQGGPDSDEVEPFYGQDLNLSWRDDGPLENEDGFGPADFPPRRFPRHGRPHGDRRPPPRPGQPHFPPQPPLPRPSPGGGRPNITGENVFMLPPTGGRPPQFGYYFKIFYNPNATVIQILSNFRPAQRVTNILHTGDTEGKSPSAITGQRTAEGHGPLRESNSFSSP
ncbi:hypothetical protein AOLI_G00191690 [Acnodon oligacanthus]